MAVIVAPSPNPNAMKFSVGVTVGGPATHLAGSDPGETFLSDLLALPGVTSIFMTADFITISKAPEASWDSIIPEATRILESQFEG